MTDGVSRRSFLSLAGASLAGAWAGSYLSALAGPDPPSIVLILADDLGYGDLGCYGNRAIRTPRLDRLSAQGLHLTQYYAGAPVCAPSRCAMLTGLQARHGRVADNPGVPLLPSDRTLAELLKAREYATGMFGKWHLGAEGTTGAPNRKGFDHAFGVWDAHQAFSHRLPWLWRDGVLTSTPEGWTPDVLASAAAVWIGQQTGPFFCYYAPCLVHANLSAPEERIAQYRGIWPETPFPGDRLYAPCAEPNATYAAMATWLDECVGRLLDAAPKDTLIVFASDNGPHPSGGRDVALQGSTGGLRGIKNDCYEGGIRVPCVLRWPGHVPAGQSSAVICAAWDIMPTLALAGGAQVSDNLDGIDLMPVWQRGAAMPTRALHWQCKHNQGIRAGRWKAVKPARFNRNTPWELYNLEADVGETTDLAAEHPDILRRILRGVSDA